MLHFAYIIIGFYGAFGRFFLPNRFKDRQIFAPDACLTFYFLPVSILYFYYDYITPVERNLFGEHFIYRRFIHDYDQEAAELLLAFGFLLFLTLNKYRQARRGMTGGQDFMAVNVGSNEWNYQVRDLAEAVAQVMPGVEISINKDAQPDKRSYRVSFDLFKKSAQAYQPKWGLTETVRELKAGLEEMDFKGFGDKDFRNSRFTRLRVLKDMRKKGLLNEKLSFSETGKLQPSFF